MFDFANFSRDYSIPTNTSGHNAAKGWVQTQCPFCGDTSDHLGYNLNSGYFNCWKCGFHPTSKVISTLLNIPFDKTKELIKGYETEYTPFKQKHIKHATKLKLPYGTGKLNKYQKRYLIERKYDPSKLEKLWNLQGTGPIGDYKHRIIAPILYNGKLVSFQGRDYTNKADLRYKTCSKDKEVIHHKDTLYGIDRATSHRTIVCEGISDVWRMGPGSIGLFGINYSHNQVLLIAERYSQVFILFDEGRIAQDKASKLGWALSGMGIQVEIITGIKGDPGDLPQNEADNLMKEIKGE